MEMPVPCSKCGEWVELNSTRESELNKARCYVLNVTQPMIQLKIKSKR